MPPRITTVTRQQIADEMNIGKLWYHGNLDEPDFLTRLFDLKGLRSNDPRYDNAYEDIRKHMVLNADWPNDWIYTDPRINLLYCGDELYLKFLSLTINPAIRTNSGDVAKLLEIYNRHLHQHGYEIIQTSEISGRPIFTGRQKLIGQASLALKTVEIRKYLNTDYVSAKISTMTEAVYKDTDLAIGTAKELLETTCKSILKQKGVAINKDWTLPQLLNNTTSALDFKPKEADNPNTAEKAIRQILGGISTIVHGVAELRNGYGTGHGKDANFKGLEVKYAKLCVSVVSEIVILFLATQGETTELVETVADDLPF
ncbi:Abortive infection C-terminus [Ohtaekwangia koreensis]|uniref:Abortive infection C-terminus n=2 Tax=Ohtaekwangia koreensis TaxID=688867 RepID=A0A1T5J733_9BACT|nr:Abortive infection C-terminus [Ohtaekwangia koreensis]